MTSTVLWRRGRFALVFHPRDIWIGVHVSKHAVYVCALPTLAFRWSRAHPAHWQAGRPR